MNSSDYIEVVVLRKLAEKLEMENPGIKPCFDNMDYYEKQVVYSYLTRRVKKLEEGL